MFLAKKPKNLNLFYDEKISAYKGYARLFVSGNKQRSKPIKIHGASRRFTHRVCLKIRYFENFSLAFVSISSESLFTVAVD